MRSRKAPWNAGRALPSWADPWEVFDMYLETADIRTFMPEGSVIRVVYYNWFGRREVFGPYRVIEISDPCMEGESYHTPHYHFVCEYMRFPEGSCSQNRHYFSGYRVSRTGRIYERMPGELCSEIIIDQLPECSQTRLF